jgi:hypothetical protein
MQSTGRGNLRSDEMAQFNSQEMVYSGGILTTSKE